MTRIWPGADTVDNQKTPRASCLLQSVNSPTSGKTTGGALDALDPSPDRCMESCGAVRRRLARCATFQRRHIWTNTSHYIAKGTQTFAKLGTERRQQRDVPHALRQGEAALI